MRLDDGGRTLTGRIVDEADRPYGFGPPFSYDALGTLRSDSSGVFRIDVDVRGRPTDFENDVFLALSSRPNTPDALAAVIPLGEGRISVSRDLGKIILRAAPVLVAGRVKDARGQPIPGVRVAIASR